MGQTNFNTIALRHALRCMVVATDDYDDLKSAFERYTEYHNKHNRVLNHRLRLLISLGHAQEYTLIQGNPSDEAIILDVLRNDQLLGPVPLQFMSLLSSNPKHVPSATPSGLFELLMVEPALDRTGVPRWATQLLNLQSIESRLLMPASPGTSSCIDIRRRLLPRLPWM
jgi:hypothetical protein